jgi:hypothetical protein
VDPCPGASIAAAPGLAPPKHAASQRGPPLLIPPPPAQDALYAPAQLTDLMAASDYVVVATPHTPDTDKIISRAAVAAMRPNGVLVNVGRGKCVDEEALIEGEGGRGGPGVRGGGLRPAVF